ncbi:MAG: tyrosine-type recombinase/integrase [Bacteroidota bacterium]
MLTSFKIATISHKFKKYVRSAHLDDGIHFHSLRHTGISWLMNKGVSPVFVQKLAGSD